MSVAALVALLRRRYAPDAPDAALLHAYAESRDEAAFRRLVARHGPSVLRLCRRLLGDSHAAEDAFQATFLILARRARTVRRPEALPAWLYGVARRVCRNARTARDRRQAAESHARPRPPAGPAAEMSACELLEVLDEELHRLPGRYREPLALVYLQGLTQTVAAQRLDLTSGALRGRLERGRTRLAARLERRGFAPGDLRPLLVAPLGATSVPPDLLAATAALAADPWSKAVPTAVLALAVAGTSAKVIVAAALGVLLAGVGLASLAGGLPWRAGSVSDRRIGNEETFNPPVAHAPGSPVDQPPRLDAFGDPLPDGVIRRLGTLRFRQGGGVIHHLLVSPDGQKLVSTDFFGTRTVCVWEMATGKLLQQFPGYYERYIYPALSPDGKTLALGWDTSVVLWDLASGREVARLTAEGLGEVTSAAFALDGKTLVAGDMSGTIQFWNLANGKPSDRLKTEITTRLSALAFTPDGKTLIVADHVGNGTVLLWDVETRKLRETENRTGRSHMMALSRDGTLMAAGGESGDIPIWDVRTGQLVHELKGARYVNSVAFAPDGKTLAAAESGLIGSRPAVSFWDVSTGELRRRAEKQRAIGSLVYSPDGQTLIAGDGGVIRLLDPQTGEERQPSNGPSFITRLLATPDCRTLAYYSGESTTGSHIQFLDLATGRDLGAIHGSAEILPCAFTPDNRTLAGRTVANALDLWDVSTRQRIGPLEANPVVATAFSPDGRVLATARPNAFIQLKDIASGRELRWFDFAQAQLLGVTSVAFTPDGRTLVASARLGDGNYRVRFWDVTTGDAIAHLGEAINSASEASSIRLSKSWHVQLQPTTVLSPDGKSLTMNRWQSDLIVWETATGQERYRLKGHEESTACLAFAPDGRTLASTSWDNTLRLWDLETGTELTKLSGHRGKANSLVFSADGRTLVSAGDDTTILFWDVGKLTLRERRPERLSDAEWEALWSELAGPDAAKAFRAIVRLTADPDTTVRIKDRLRPAAAIDSQRLARLIRDLDDDRFATRDAASREFSLLGDVTRPELEKALARPGVSPEFRQRLEQALSQLTRVSGEGLRALRAVEVLERLATPDAQQLLQAVAAGDPGARLTREAKASLDRLR